MSPYNRKTLLVGVAIAVIIGGGVSYFASRSPDGLEKTQADLGLTQPPHEGVTAPAVVFHEYGLKWLGEGFWSNAIAGVTGVLLVLGLLLGLGRWMKAGKSGRDADAPASRQP
jgi:hypothetical protein